MDSNPMTSPRKTAFRQHLRRELATWRDEGLVSDEQAAALTQRYGLDQLGGESRRLLFTALYILGALLIGGSVVTFVAAHWTGLMPWQKTTALLAAMLAAHAAGYYLWRDPNRHPALGHSLVLLGTLIFGANIFLLAQIFHVRSDFYNGFLLWTVGALAVGLLLRSQPNLIVAVAASFVWAMGAAIDHAAAALFYPLIALAFVPLLQRWRHLIAIAVLLPAVGIAAVTAVFAHTEDYALLALAVVGALYTGVAAVLTVRDDEPRTRRTGWIIGTACAAVPAYWYSFEAIARHAFTSHGRAVPPEYWWIPLAILGAAAVAAWMLALRKWVPARSVPAYAIGLLAAFAAFIVSIAARDSAVMMVMMNIAFLSIAAGLIWTGVAASERGLFWAGLTALVLLIITRSFEYDTGLITKSAAMLVSGLGLIFAGTAFERRLKGGEHHA
jgi:uncharacterized membrane protein